MPFHLRTDVTFSDGTPLTADASSVTVSGLSERFTYTCTVSGSLTDAGTAESEVTDWTIFDADGKDVTASFTGVTTEKGTLTVNKATATVSTGSASKPYDGTPLTKDEAPITGLVSGDTATVTANGTITDVTADGVTNTYSIAWGDTNPDN